MNKTIIVFVSLTALAVVAYLFFEDLTIRIVSIGIGGISFAGALVLALRSLRSGEEEDKDRNGPVPADSGSIAETENDVPGSDVPFPAAAASPGRASRVHLPDEIPEECYRFDHHSIPTDDPTAEFDFAVQHLLRALKEHVLAHTAGLFWINTDRQHVVVSGYVTDSKYFTTAKRLPLGEDPVSRIGLTGKPVILSAVAEKSAQDTLIYYDQRPGVRSFAGVPLFFMDDPIAVLAVDSIALDAFGVETIMSMGKYAGILTLLVASYDQKFDLRADSKTLAVLDDARKSMQSALDPYGICSAAADAGMRLLDWDYIAVILFNPEKQGWIVMRSLSRVPNLPYVSEGVTVEVEKSILRPVLLNREGCILDAPEAPGFRFHEKEVVASQGQICAAPISTTRRCVGFVMTEYREGAQYGKRDLEMLRRVGDLAGLFLDISYSRDLLRKHLLIDEATQTGSRAYLMQRLQEEHHRIRRHGGNAVFLLAGVDNPEDLAAEHGPEGMDVILAQLARLLRDSLQPFDVIGRCETSRLGLILLHTNAEDAYIRGEKMRKAAAGMILARAGISFSLTASIAGCALSEDNDLDHVLRVARQAMDLAVGEGGNCVKVV